MQQESPTRDTDLHNSENSGDMPHQKHGTYSLESSVQTNTNLDN